MKRWLEMSKTGTTLGLALIVTIAGATGVLRAQSAPTAGELTGLKLAQHHFYSGRYLKAVEVAAPLTKSGPDALAAYELRTSALHFQLKRLLGDAPNKGRALKQCADCAGLLDAFARDLNDGKALARTRLKSEPHHVPTLFYLGKLDLNYVWLQLSTLGRRTGWGEYWNARRSMDTVLKLDPANLYDKYIGDSEKNFKRALQTAERMAPVILWIDEIEKAFASAAAQSVDGGLSKRMFGSLLTWMQEHTSPVFLVATANNTTLSDGQVVEVGTVVESSYHFDERPPPAPNPPDPEELDSNGSAGSKGPLDEATRTFSVYCDEISDNTFLRVIQVPFKDPVTSPESGFDELRAPDNNSWNLLDTVEQVCGAVTAAIRPSTSGARGRFSAIRFS